MGKRYMACSIPVLWEEKERKWEDETKNRTVTGLVIVRGKDSLWLVIKSDWWLNSSRWIVLEKGRFRNQTFRYYKRGGFPEPLCLKMLWIIHYIETVSTCIHTKTHAHTLMQEHIIICRRWSESKWLLHYWIWTRQPNPGQTLMALEASWAYKHNRAEPALGPNATETQSKGLIWYCWISQRKTEKQDRIRFTFLKKMFFSNKERRWREKIIYTWNSAMTSRLNRKRKDNLKNLKIISKYVVCISSSNLDLIRICSVMKSTHRLIWSDGCLGIDPIKADIWQEAGHKHIYAYCHSGPNPKSSMSLECGRKPEHPEEPSLILSGVCEQLSSPLCPTFYLPGVAQSARGLGVRHTKKSRNLL